MNSTAQPTATTPLVLVVEDEPAIASILTAYLERDGLRSRMASDGQEALQLFRQLRPDLVLLDIHLPGMDGIDVLRAIRDDSQTPVIMVTALADDVDKLLALRLGADDYVVKPFSPRELAARVKAILRRGPPRVSTEAAPTGPFRVDEERCLIHYRGQALNLTLHEFRLLQALLARPGRVFSRELLLQALGVAAQAGYERNIDSHIKSLRAKLRQVAADAEPIQTHRGLGYSYAAEKA